MAEGVILIARPTRPRPYDLGYIVAEVVASNRRRQSLTTSATGSPPKSHDFGYMARVFGLGLTVATGKTNTLPWK